MTYEINLNKKKLALMIGAGILFVVLGIALLFNANDFQNHRHHSLLRNPWVIRVTSVLCILFFGAIAAYLTKKIFDNEPGLIINETGVFNNTNGFKNDVIEWKNISDIQVKQLERFKYILIKVKHPELYVEEEANWLKKKHMQANIKTHGTPIIINTNALNHDFQQIEKILKDEFNKNKAKG